MHKVKLFDYGRISDLEKSVNEFLEKLYNDNRYELIDIKLTSYNYGDERKDYHTAMIIYKA